MHFEFQTTDSYDPEMSLRMAGYIIRAIEVYRLPVYSNVIYLRPDAGKNDPGRYVQHIEDHNISIEYKVFRLIDLDGENVLDSRLTGLVPFTPLMGHQTDIDADQWLRRCVQVADSIDVPDKASYLGSLAILGNIVYDSQTIMDILLEETMQNAQIVEHVAPQAREQGFQAGIEQGKAEGIEQGKAEGIEQGKAEGIEQGKAEGTRKHILEVLALQFGDDTAQNFNESIEAIDDLQRLDILFRAALQAENEDDFKEAIEGNNK